MKVILQKDVPNLGDAGDIKEVADGYARNYLIPQKMVIVASEAGRRIIEHQKKIIKLKKEKRRKASEQVASQITGKELHIAVRVGEEDKLFGSVTPIDIAKKLHEEGFELDKRKILLESPIKELGEYDIAIRLDDGITSNVKVFVEKA
ncbi:MAG: 50S ribosomal protein L9 [Leptospirales bacterium]|nr:50S ribosomal protein L9 [Leptospirales bacterium]